MSTILQPEIRYNDYRLWVDEDTGAWRCVRLSTQEESDIDVLFAPPGSRIKTPADVETEKALKEQRHRFLEQKEQLKK